MSDVIRVVVTGAAGQIGYSLVPLIASGQMFGKNQKVALNMLDITPAMKALGGVVMELEDGAYPLLVDVVATDDIKTAFSNVDVAILVGAMPRKPGMERADLLKVNCSIFKTQGEALNNFAKPNVKVLVVGNPANTNCSIAQACAPRIPAKNWSCLTRLDHNRAKSQIAKKAGVNVSDVKNVTIWGNHSSTQFPDASHGTINGKPIGSTVNDDKWIQETFVSTVQKRGAAIMDARGLSSAMSAANAIVDHMHDWFLGTPEGEWVSMGVLSTGLYGVPADLIYSFPVTCKNGEYHIVEGLSVSPFAREKMDATAKELIEEKTTAHSFLDGGN